MPITKNVFIKGKMNKDLDERIVPNGEYRDALNVQISTSDGSDIGVMQNVLGNQAKSSIGITGAQCIGSIADTENNKIYWFIAGTDVDAIAEYEEATGNINPVLVSVKATDNVLNFSKTKLITGINVIDGLLLFTDDNSEPKKINIEDCKNGSTDFATHTVLTKYNSTTYNFSEEDITVIKKFPKYAPSISMANTARIKSDGTPAIVNAIASASFAYNNELLDSGDNKDISIYTRPDLKVGDRVRATLAEEVEESQEDTEIILTVDQLPSSFYPPTYKFVIESISENTPILTQKYLFELIEEDPLFEKEFVRFAYRYKYADGEYSVMSPFSEIAFLPKKFEYDSAKGHNRGMENDLRYLKIEGFSNAADVPFQTKEIELLLKKDTGTNIYSVQSFEYTDKAWVDNSYEISSELIHKVLPSNQLLRPYDNVPLKAKAQEIVANRLIYGNYLQNFDLKDLRNADYKPKFQTRLNLNKNKPTTGSVGKSIKSMRTYQLGVTFIDKYGRETPVQTDDSGSIKVNKAYANKYSGISVALHTAKPTFATSFKYYIKETSNEYYNLAMDRWYDAEDGNVWISFPSSERNKINEESFIILKKAHNTDDLVEDTAKYKIIDIKNEAPDEIKEIKTSYGVVESPATGANFFHETDFPKPDATFFKIIDGDGEVGFEDTFGQNSNLLLDSNRFVRIKAPSLGSSKFYEVESIGKGEGYYTINLAKKFEGDVSGFFPDGTNTGRLGGVSKVGAEFFQSKIKNKKEYIGRFFAKIYKDGTLATNVLNLVETPEYSIISTVDIYQRFGKKRDLDDYRKDEDRNPRVNFYVDQNNMVKWRTEKQGTKLSLMPDGNTYYAWHFEDPISPGRNQFALQYLNRRDVDGIKTNRGGMHAEFITAMTTQGTLFRFTQDPNKVVYKIKNWCARGGQKVDRRSGNRGSDNWGENNHALLVFELDKKIQGFEVTESNSDVDRGDYFNIEILEAYDEAGSFKSENPAIFETEPKEAVDIDIYYEASNALPMTVYGYEQALDWSNCFSFGNGVESNRIRDDFNAPTIAKGVRVSAPLAEQYKQERRKNGLIFSGIFNSRSGINRLNQFIAAENITKDLNPEYGSIQKLHTRDTDLITFCEDKVLKVLAQKDALFNADGNANVTSNAAVLGQAIPFIGEFGISKNPESFASYGYRMYFADKARGTVMRLSRNGLEAISSKGMSSYFYDNLKIATEIIGTFDVRKGNYNLTLINKDLNTGNLLENIDTISYKEEAQGWPSRKSYIPESGLSLNNVYYTFKNGELYSHDNETRNTFYGEATAKSSVKLILNSNPSEIKNYKTINYEGNPGWKCPSIITDQQNGHIPLDPTTGLSFIEEEGKHYNYVKGIENTWDNASQTGGLDTKEFSTQGIDVLQSITDATGQTEVTITIKENND